MLETAQELKDFIIGNADTYNKNNPNSFMNNELSGITMLSVTPDEYWEKHCVLYVTVCNVSIALTLKKGYHTIDVWVSTTFATEETISVKIGSATANDFAKACKVIGVLLDSKNISVKVFKSISQEQFEQLVQNTV